MTKKSDIQKICFADLQDQELFNRASRYGNEYLATVLDRNVYPTEEAIENLSVFEEPMPEVSTKATDVIDMLHKFGAPATIPQVGGRYFGFVDGSAVPAGMAAKELATFWDQNAAMYISSPIASKLETIVENWLKELFDLPERTVAGFVSGASLATFCGLAAARYRLLERTGWDVNEKGLFGAPKIRVIASKEAHSTIFKAIGLLGFGKENVELIHTDEQGRILAEEIPELDDKTLLILQAGNVNSGAFDAFDEILEQANQSNAWVHIDGAFGLWAGVAEELRYLTKGIEKANSWSLDGHKTLNTPYDAGVVLCEDKDALISALQMAGNYIVESKEKDGMFYTPEMSRRARSVEFWATMKYLGKNGISEMVQGMHERAIQFKEELVKNGFKILNDVVFNQVVVFCGSDKLTLQTMKNVQQARECWAGGSKWKGKAVIRISVSSWATTAEDVTRSVHSFVEARDQAKDEIGELKF